MHAAWPEVQGEDVLLSRISHYLDKALSEVRAAHGKSCKKKGATPGTISPSVCRASLVCAALCGGSILTPLPPPNLSSSVLAGGARCPRLP